MLGLFHETNTYSSRLTTLSNFEEFELLEGDALTEGNRNLGSVIGGFLDESSFEFVPCLAASAWPGGPVSAEAWSHILARSRATLERAGDVDGVLLNLHGAMVAEDEDDPEGVLVRAVRELLPHVPIACVLDLHANPTPELVSACDVVISYDTYPHVDMRDRGREAAQFMRTMLDGRRLETTLAKLPLLTTPLSQATDAEPMRGLQARAVARARAAGVERVCILGGYCYSDVPRAGVSVLVVHSTDRAAAGREVLRDTTQDVRDHAADFEVQGVDPEEAVVRAIASTRRPVILADVADNVGGGSPGDGTTLLRALLQHDATGAVVIIADPEAAILAHDAGAGATVAMSVGGKTDRHHGEPVEIEGKVVQTSDGTYTTHGTWMTDREFSMGRTAVVEVAGVLIVLTELRVPPFHSEQLTSVGIEPASMHIIVAKGALAWKAAFGDVAAETFSVATPGICPIDPHQLVRRTEPMEV